MGMHFRSEASRQKHQEGMSHFVFPAKGISKMPFSPETHRTGEAQGMARVPAAMWILKPSGLHEQLRLADYAGALGNLTQPQDLPTKA